MLPDRHLMYLNRCNQLASLGKGYTKTNPLVGALLVHNDHIIGEGYHTQYGAAHAEIEAIKSVTDENKYLIPESTLYVNLEPCCIYSKTPPCTEEIIRQKIRKVIIGMADPNPKINGKGIEFLKSYHVEVEKIHCGAEDLNKSFIKNMTTGLPYVILKFAMTTDGFIGQSDKRVKISNPWSEYIVHKIRHQVDGILIGTNTALIDNPALTNRLYFDLSPTRIILDKEGVIPVSFSVFNDSATTLLVSDSIADYPQHVKKINWIEDKELLLKKLYSLGIGSLLVEGGAKTLQSFIDSQLWDEIWCTKGNISIHSGIKAPVFDCQPYWKTHIGNDELSVYYRHLNSLKLVVKS